MKKIPLIIITLFLITSCFGQKFSGAGGAGTDPTAVDTLLGDTEASNTYAPIDNPTFTTGIAIGSADLEEAELEILDGLTITTAEGNYLSGATSNIQDQLDDTVAAADEVFMLVDSNSVGGAVTWTALHNEPTLSNYVNTINEFAGESVVKALPVLFSLGGGGTFSMTDQRAYYVLFYLPEADTITGIKTTLSTAGNYTHDNFNGAALYSVSGATYTRVALSKNSVAEPNIWETAANNLITIAFDSTGVYSAAAGLYMLGIVYSASAQTTAPILYQSDSDYLLNELILSDSKETMGYVSNVTDMPAEETAGDITSYSFIPYVILY